MKFILEVDPDLDDTATARELLRFAIAACEAPPGTQVDDVLAAFHAAYTKQKEGTV